MINLPSENFKVLIDPGPGILRTYTSKKEIGYIFRELQNKYFPITKTAVRRISISTSTMVLPATGSLNQKDLILFLYSLKSL
jgi:hypothetical protein